MSPLDADIIRRKLAVIIENLQALTPMIAMPPHQYAEDIYKRKATERLLQELIEAAIDINTHIIVQTGHQAPDDYYHTFVRMGELEILRMELALKLAPSAGLRNRLVHEYDAIENSFVLESVKMANELYSGYVKEVEGFLARLL